MKRFGAFEGVFTPTILCILGVIMYLRLGWVVGQGGLRNALIIVVAANLISLCTGLSLSSMVTNIRIGHGGVYSIITKSLGFEMGGAIGLPLFLAQAVSVAFYVTGFAEGWGWIFPDHSVKLVSVAAWLILFVIAYTSARLAFRLQYLMMAIIGLSLLSVFLSPALSASPTVIKGLGEVSFWHLFAIFFPAVTGILAGVSMSGELKNPCRDIPLGTLGAIGLSFVIYIAMTFWYASAAPAADLVAEHAISVTLARWRPLVLAGIMGATISSALSLMVAAPRVLFALASNRMIPFSGIFNRVSDRQEPIPAIVFGSAIALTTFLLGTLNAIAELLTMFFLLTYGMINLAVLVEQGIGIPSFRPAFRVPLLVPAMGTVMSAAVLIMISPIFSLAAALVVSLVYLFLLTRNVQGGWPDVRRGFFIFIAEKALRIASKLPYHPKIWKPNLLVPVSGKASWSDLVPFISDLASPAGRVTLLRLNAFPPPEPAELIGEDLDLLVGAFQAEGLLVSAILLDGRREEGMVQARAAISSVCHSFLPPNLLFLVLKPDPDYDELLGEMLSAAESNDLGVMMLSLPPAGGYGRGKEINLWLRPGSPNLNLGVLIALQLQRNWQGRLRLVQVVERDDEREEALSYFRRLKGILRITGRVESSVLTGTFLDAVARAPAADVNLFGLQRRATFSWARRIAAGVGTASVFFQDSRFESARA